MISTTILEIIFLTAVIITITSSFLVVRLAVNCRIAILAKAEVSREEVLVADSDVATAGITLILRLVALWLAIWLVFREPALVNINTVLTFFTFTIIGSSLVNTITIRTHNLVRERKDNAKDRSTTAEHESA